MSEHFLIVGGGAVGLTSALALLQSGYRVTLIERGQIGQEASWAGGGIMSPLCSWDYSEAVTRLTQRSMDMWPEASALLHAATGIDPEYQRNGMLILPPYPAERAEDWCKSHQVEYHRTALSHYLPGIQCEDMPGDGLLLPEIAQIRNPRLLRALRRRVELLGGTLLEQLEARHFEIRGGQILCLHSSQGLLTADGYIVTAGAWSKVLLGEHALNLDVRPVRGQMLLFKFDTPPFRQILLQDNLYLIPRQDGHVLVGSTLEEVGFDQSTTQTAADSLLQRAQALFSGWPQPIRHWAGLRPGSRDNIPTIGRHPELANLYANCGHFRYGVTMSLASAELLHNEIAGLAQPLPADAYRWL